MASFFIYIYLRHLIYRRLCEKNMFLLPTYILRKYTNNLIYGLRATVAFSTNISFLSHELVQQKEVPTTMYLMMIMMINYHHDQ